jgi:energy-coupling factor transport system permease protein
MRQPWVWVIWLVAVLVMLSITRNPLYLLIILLCVLFVGLAMRESSSELLRPFSLWKFAIWIILLATGFNAFTSHYGETVLFTIPGSLPLISGNVTLEALVYGATNGLILTGMLMSVSVLNMAIPMRELISLIPRAFFQVAVVTSIAVTYLPTTLRQFQQIREAQAVRGHQVRSLRDWLPLLMPLLVGGLEHAMQLAEAMTARGFASHKPMLGKRQFYPRLSMLLGVILLAAGWVEQLASARGTGWALILLGAGLILMGLWFLGNQSQRTVYHRRGWSWQDGLNLIVVAFILALILLPVPGLSHESLYYEPYPRLTLPLFNPVLGLVMLGYLIPGLWVNDRHPNEIK